MSVTRALGILLGGTGLLCSACTLNAEASRASAPALKCTMAGEEHAGATAADVCISFTQAIAPAGLRDGLEVEVTALSPTSARAVARAASGRMVLERDFDVMDEELDAALWSDFAAQFARDLKAVRGD